MTKRLQGRYLSYFIIIITIFLSIFVSSVLLLVANIKIIKAENDNLAPKEPHVSVSITNPPANVQTVLEKSIIINGTATSDTGGSGINRVEAFVQKMPFNGTGQYILTTPVQEGNWSRWSFPVTLNDTGSYRVQARVTDNAGEQNWAEVTIVLPSHIYAKKIGLVEPTFTYAAYRTGSFYDFYKKYSFKDAWYANKTITTDLNLLKNRPIPHGPFPYYGHPQYLDIPYIGLLKFTRDHLQVDPFVTNLTDVDVHEGKIFHSDGSNAYDDLFIFHNEYVTASEFNNLRQFVTNGGTLEVMEGNRLYAEISYNKTNDSITLVKGHNWEFVDGKGATRSINERWLNESKEWMGSNFFDVPSSEKVYFRNNPFNYTHTEEQYVTNPRAKILINFDTSYSSKHYPKPIIAAYYMDYGKGGRTIDLSIWTHSLVDPDNKAFVKYFDDTIIPLTLGRISSLHVISLPPIIAEATRPSGAIVTYSIPSVSNSTNTQSVSDCKPTSGSFFPIGNTIVKCTAKDDKNAITEITSFTVQVEEQPNQPFSFIPRG